MDSTLLAVPHPSQVGQSADGFEGVTWVRWGTFSVYGVKLHLLCATNRVPLSYELTAANVADARLVGELLEEADLLGDDGVARRLLGDLAYRSGQLEEALASAGVLLTTEKAATGGPLKGSRWRCDSRRSSGYSGWPRRWRDSSPGSRRRSALTPTPSWSTGCWADRRGASKTCRPRNHATLI